MKWWADGSADCCRFAHSPLSIADTLLSDLEKATDRLPNSNNYSSSSGNKMNSSYTTNTVVHGPNRQTTTTISKYEYSKSNTGNDSIYQNDKKTNMNDLNTFLNEFDHQTKYHQQSGHTNGYSTYSKRQTDSSQQVNQLISNLENNLANPNEALKWKGEQLKPITMTEYYEESKKVSSLGNSGSTNTRTENRSQTTERLRSTSPARSPTRLRTTSPIHTNTEKTLTTRTYETTTTSKHNSNQNVVDSSNRNQSSSYNQSINQQQRQSTTKASNATAELDDLMQNLDGFKLNEKKQTRYSSTRSDTPEYASINKNRQTEDSFHQRSSSSGRKTISSSKESKEIKNLGPLENIIGSIEIEMNKQGLDTLAKGSCYVCNKSIVGQVITALGRTYHPEHFCCAYCKQELGERTFFEREGKCYCETDYHNLFAPKCNYCSEPITGRQKCVSALNTTFHAEHFFCYSCNIQFNEDRGYHEHNSQAYCSDCYLDAFAPKCYDCNKPITSAFISALGGQWHPHCFVCADCRCEFAAGAFFEYEGKPYCETHFHAKKGTLCAGCHKPITGRCVTAMFRKFHPNHFVCSYCLKQLNKGTFKEQNDKPYCHSCFERVFS